MKVTWDKPKTSTLSGSGGKVALEYDGDGQRIRKTTTGMAADTETVYLGDFYPARIGRTWRRC